MIAVVMEETLIIGLWSPFLECLIVFLLWLLIKGKITVLEYQSIFCCQKEEREAWGAEERHRREFKGLDDQVCVHHVSVCGRGWRYRWGVGTVTALGCSSQYSPGGIRERKATKLRCPMALGLKWKLKEPVTAMGQGRRQLICMLNMWKWEQIAEPGDKYWTGSGPETKPTLGNEKLLKANELPGEEKGGGAEEKPPAAPSGFGCKLACHREACIIPRWGLGNLSVKGSISLYISPFLSTFSQFLAILFCPPLQSHPEPDSLGQCPGNCHLGVVAEHLCTDDRGLGQWPAWKNGVEINKGLEAQFIWKIQPFYLEGILLIVAAREKVVGFITRFLLFWKRHREMVVEMADLSRP